MESDLIRIKNTNKDKVKFDIFSLTVFEILFEKFGYRYIRIKGKGKYLKPTQEGYEIVSIQNLKDCFTNFLRYNFDRNTLPKEISYHDFMNKYYQKSPVTSSYASSFLNTYSELNEEDFEIKGRLLKSK